MGGSLHSPTHRCSRVECFNLFMWMYRKMESIKNTRHWILTYTLVINIGVFAITGKIYADADSSPRAVEILDVNSSDGVVNYHAVICGIADYPGREMDLNYTDDDAHDVYKVLIASANWKAENITLLVDRAATRSAIQSAIDDMCNKADSDDICLFYFSGHGGTAETDYLPEDELDGFDEYICAYDLDIIDDELGKWLAELPTRKYIVFLDTCRSGEDANPISSESILDSLGDANSTGNIVSMKDDGFAADIAVNFGSDAEIRAEDFDDYDRGVAVAACEADQTSEELFYVQNGLFTYFLVQGMAGPADDNGNGWISAEECYDYVRPRAENIDSDYLLHYANNEPNIQNAKMYDGHSGELEFLQLPNCIQALDSFESSGFDDKWAHYGDADWSITDDERPFKTYSAGTGAIEHNRYSTLKLTWDFPADGYITFWRRISSELRWQRQWSARWKEWTFWCFIDDLTFYIDDELAGAWAGDGDLPDEGWAKVGFPIFAGSRTLKWTYSKDSSWSEGFDQAWIDDISFRSHCQCPLHAPVLHSEPTTILEQSNTISWDQVLGANRYYAQCATGSNFADIHAYSGWISETDYTFTDLNIGQTYWYRVKARPSETWVQTSKPDFEANVLSDTIATSDGDVVLLPNYGLIYETNTVGSTRKSYTNSAQTKLVAYYCTKPCTLYAIEMHLNIPAGNSVEAQFVVYEAYTKSGQYTQIHADNKSIKGEGDTFYSSGYIGIPLEPGRYYTIGAAWKQAVTYYWGQSDSDVEFGNAFGHGSINSYPPRDEHSAPITDNWYYHQKITTIPAEYVSSGNIISTQIDLPAGDWDWATVELDANTPEATNLTVDVLYAFDNSVLLSDLEPGTDISGIDTNSIKLQANLTTDDPNITPALHDWSVTYTNASCESEWSDVTQSMQQ